MAIRTVKVRGTLYTIVGNAYVGQVTFTSAPLTDPATKHLIVPRTYTAKTDITGRFSIDLPATDSYPNFTPAVWQYTVQAPGWSFTLSLPVALNEIDLSAPTVPVGLPAPTPTPAPVLPTKVVAEYWRTDSSPPLTQADSRVNVFFLSFAKSAASGTGRLYFNPDEGSGVSPQQMQSDIAAVHGRGAKVILSIGGSVDGGITMQNQTQVTELVNSVNGIVRAYGVDGVDWDLENGGTGTNLASLTSASTQLKATWGPFFAVTVSAEPGLGLYEQFALAGPCDLYVPQFYDYPADTPTRRAGIVANATKMVGQGLPSSKYGIGCTYAGSYLGANGQMPVSEYVAAWQTLAGQGVITRGASVWDMTIEAANGYPFAAGFAAAMDAPVPVPVPPGGPPVPSGYPGPLTTGPRVAAVHTHPGGNISDPSDLPSWVSGAGTATDPWLVTDTRFTSNVHVTSWGSLPTRAGTLKFVRCTFDGNPGDPTPGGSHCLQVDDRALARVIVEDSTLGPNSPVAVTGGPVGGGVDKAFISWCPFELRRCNLWGACVPVYFELEIGEAGGLIEACWIHDVWSSAGDHTDLINGNFHASHITIRGCMLDGIRTGNSRVVNGIGIYNDPTGVVISDWTIDGNYIDRCVIGILATTDPGLFKDPFVVTNNVFARYGRDDHGTDGARFVARTPSSQSGNVDVLGAPIRF